MSKGDVNKRFIAAAEHVLGLQKDLKKGDFAKSIGLSAQAFTEILGERMKVPMEALQKFFEVYGVSYSFIFEGKKPILNADIPVLSWHREPTTGAIAQEPPGESGVSVRPTVRPTVRAALEKHIADGQFRGQTVLKMPQVITVDSSGEENILYVPVKARAGYLLGYGDPTYISKLPAYRLPGLRNGTYRMFEVDGPSMAPTILSGDRVIAQFLGGFDEIHANRVHVLVTRSEGIVVKRVLNRISQRGKLVLKSDTITQRKDYPTYEIDPEDVIEIWYCRMKLSGDFSEPAEIYNRVSDLEADLVAVKTTNSLMVADLQDIKAALHLTGQKKAPAKQSGAR